MRRFVTGPRPVRTKRAIEHTGVKPVQQRLDLGRVQHGGGDQQLGRPRGNQARVTFQELFDVITHRTGLLS
jgi:hypothetical protein